MVSSIKNIIKILSQTLDLLTPRHLKCLSCYFSLLSRSLQSTHTLPFSGVHARRGTVAPVFPSRRGHGSGRLVRHERVSRQLRAGSASDPWRGGRAGRGRWAHGPVPGRDELPQLPLLLIPLSALGLQFYFRCVYRLIIFKKKVEIKYGCMVLAACSSDPEVLFYS